VNRVRPLPSRVARVLVLMCVGALTLTGCDFSVYSLPLPGGADLGDHPYTVHVQFRDVLDLVPQSAVKVDDVTVGKVDKIDLRGYTADVTVQLKGSVKLPDNAVADIRQTSLLGEKFVSLSPPEGVAPVGRLGNGDVIPLSRSGRNPEVEEVLGALSLLLNGGGVAQLKTIATELNKALDGREGDVRSVLDQLNTFMGQLDKNKDQIVAAIESLDRLAVALNKQKGTIQLALDQLPHAIASINRQRDDLVKMLHALSRLSDVGTRVIAQSKTATIDSLQALAPTLTKLAQAGDSLPKSLQVFLTYPFVDAVVGKNPAQARNLHMGDYTDLSIKTDIDVASMSAPGVPGAPDCSSTPLAPLCGGGAKTLSLVQQCLNNPGTVANPSKVCRNVINNGGLPQLKRECAKKANSGNPVCKLVAAGGGGGGGGGVLGGVSGTLGGLTGSGAPRTGFGAAGRGPGVDPRSVDSDLGAMLVWGMVQR
jgi:phospholipid/cholesterol/gamma-HCH transport system substrate-binding protein